ncbi:pyridoxal 5'-phosphate synthase lyase subunit PdxS, partial [Sulfolobus sp. A20-N-F6]
MRLYELSFAEIEEFFYKLAEVKDTLKGDGLLEFLPELEKELPEIAVGTARVKHAFPIFQKGGVVMDVTNVQQAQIAEEAGAVAVMVLDKLPYDVRKSGGVARMADPKVIEEVMNSITIPVMAKVRIGHYYEAKVLEALGVDMIDESEVLTPADEEHHINKWEFKVPFVNGARNLAEALRRISEGASMIRTKGEAGTGNVSEAVKHIKIINSEIRNLVYMAEEDRMKKAREYQVPYQIVELTAKLKRLPIVNFAAGGIATPADAALMM